MLCAMYRAASDNESPATKRRKRVMSGYGLSPRLLGDGADSGVCVDAAKYKTSLCRLAVSPTKIPCKNLTSKNGKHVKM